MSGWVAIYVSMYSKYGMGSNNASQDRSTVLSQHALFCDVCPNIHYIVLYALYCPVCTVQYCPVRECTHAHYAWGGLLLIQMVHLDKMVA